MHHHILSCLTQFAPHLAGCQHLDSHSSKLGGPPLDGQPSPPFAYLPAFSCTSAALPSARTSTALGRSSTDCFRGLTMASMAASASSSASASISDAYEGAAEAQDPPSPTPSSSSSSPGSGGRRLPLLKAEEAGPGRTTARESDAMFHQATPENI